MRTTLASETVLAPARDRMRISPRKRPWLERADVSTAVDVVDVEERQGAHARDLVPLDLQGAHVVRLEAQGPR